MAANLFLIGLRGTGKSTVGPLLAERLGLPFFDADAELEATAGRSIREIFAAEGEPPFRDLEEKLLVALLARGPAVIATGGGVVLREANRRRLSDSGRVVWLTADHATLWQRLQNDPAGGRQRPNLAGGGMSEIEELARQREPLYRSVAHLTISVVGRSPEQVASDIVTACSDSSSTKAR